MIRYALKCDEGHAFDSWFQSAGAFDTLKASGHLCCAICGSPRVEKSLMAPAVAPEATAPSRPADRPDPAVALDRLRRKVEETSEYVGPRFADEARAIHLGDRPERSIWGEAKPEEARSLVEDGVPIAPLPFVPKSKAN